MMERPVDRLFSKVVKKRLLCFSIALLLCILAYAYQSIYGTGTERSFAANVSASTIGGVVFNDANVNGKLDAQETGIRGVTVHLYHTDGTLAGTAVTDARGEYSFTIIPNTDYQIKLDNAVDYTTGPLKGYRLTAVHSDACDDRASSRAVLAGNGKYPQIAVNGQALAHNEYSFDVGFTTASISGKPVVDDNGTISSSLHYCYPFGDERPAPGSPSEVTPTPEGVTPIPGSQPGVTPTAEAKKPIPIEKAKKPASTLPTAYPKLPATGSNPAGHALP